MKSFFKKISLILIITVFFLEIFGLILSKMRIIPNGSPAVVSIFAHEKWTYWHPKNITFKHDYNICWGPTKITFNNIGSRSTKDVQIKKTKPRIGLLGDSMIELIQVNDGNDITSLLQKKLPDYEIINFSSRATGLYDHLDMYKNLIKKYDVDYIFYFPTENDMQNNFIKTNEPKAVFNQPLFYFDEQSNKVIKLDRNKEWMDKYFSNYNNLKRSKLVLYLKDYSYSFKIYYHIKTLIRNNKITKVPWDKERYEYAKNELLPLQEKVYKHIMSEFVSEIENNNVNLITILNLRSYLFTNEDLSYDQKIRFEKFKIIKKAWQKYNNASFDLDEAKEFINLNSDKIVKPYSFLGHVCDDHYSKFGSEFMSNIIVKNLKKYIANN